MTGAITRQDQFTTRTNPYSGAAGFAHLVSGKGDWVVAAKSYESLPTTAQEYKAKAADLAAQYAPRPAPVMRYEAPALPTEVVLAGDEVVANQPRRFDILGKTITMPDMPKVSMPAIDFDFSNIKKFMPFGSRSEAVS